MRVIAATLIVSATIPARADNCSGLSDCFSGNLIPALLLLLGLILLIAAAWYLGPLLARFAITAVTRTILATGVRSRIALSAAVLFSRFANRAMTFTQASLQHAFRRASQFGVTGKWNPAAGARFQQAIQSHIADKGTLAFNGTLRGQPVTHFYNPQTGLYVARGADGSFLSAWKPSAQAIEHLLRTGRLGGS